MWRIKSVQGAPFKLKDSSDIHVHLNQIWISDFGIEISNWWGEDRYTVQACNPTLNRNNSFVAHSKSDINIPRMSKACAYRRKYAKKSYFLSYMYCIYIYIYTILRMERVLGSDPGVWIFAPQYSTRKGRVVLGQLWYLPTSKMILIDLKLVIW